MLLDSLAQDYKAMSELKNDTHRERVDLAMQEIKNAQKHMHLCKKNVQEQIKKAKDIQEMSYQSIQQYIKQENYGKNLNLKVQYKVYKSVYKTQEVQKLSNFLNNEALRLQIFKK